MSNHDNKPDLIKTSASDKTFSVDFCHRTEALRIELDRKRSEIDHCYGVIQSMISKLDVGSLESHKLNQDLKISQEDNRYLWNEIGKLRHGYDTLGELNTFYQDELKRYEHWANSLTESIGQSCADVIIPTVPSLKKRPVQADYVTDYEPDKKLIRNFHCGLDVPESHLNRDTGEMIHIGGWCFDSDGHVPRRVWVVVGDQKIPCSCGWKREDVVQEFKGLIGADLRCGFNVEISAASGANYISVHAEFSNGAEVVLFERVIIKVGSGKVEMGQLDQDYESWIEMFDTLGEDDIKRIESHIDQFKDKPVISILLPTYNTDERWLSEAIESVRAQIYPHWELCIADDASPLSHVRSILEYYAKIDSRIKIEIRSENGHISAATNTALTLATGEFCALLDHDDTLPKDAFYHVVHELNQYPGTHLIFSDEDKMDEQGRRFDPYFKSDWNPELFCSHNCISHLGVYRTSILREIGGFKEELFGSQDWDLAFRFIEKAGQNSIRHIPRVLYHWRYLETSTSMSIESKPYAVVAGMRAIENHLHNKGVSASVMKGMWAGAFRVKYHLKQPTKVSVIIDSGGNILKTRECLLSLLETSLYSHFEILLIQGKDEGSNPTDPLFSHPRIRCIHSVGQGGLAERYNEAVKAATGEVLLFLARDTEVTHEDWLDELVSHAVQQEVGAVGAWLQFPDLETQHGGLILREEDPFIFEAFRGLPDSDIGHMGRAHLIQRYSAVSAVCMATLKSDFLKIGGFDIQHFGEVYFDVDYCLRLKREMGLHCVWTPYAKLRYRELYPRGCGVDLQEITAEKEIFHKRWAGVLRKDPYFNPNLSLDDPRFFLSWPPRVDKPWEFAT